MCLKPQKICFLKEREFWSENGVIKIIKGNKTIIQGRKIGVNIYKLKLQAPAKVNFAKAKRTIDEWHRAFSHPSRTEIANISKNGSTIGLKIVEESKKDTGCGECASEKAHRVSHPESGRERAKEVLNRVHADLVGPVTPASLSGHKYFYSLKDKFSVYMYVYFLVDKTQVAVATKKFFNEVSVVTQKSVKIVRTDNGSEFKNSTMDWLCMSEGTIQEFSAAYNAEQNGDIERANRTIIETARAMMRNTALPQTLWGEAVKTAVYLRNRISSKRTNDTI